jgi:lincosamide nucleotidyltransferase A/C/D/E
MTTTAAAVHEILDMLAAADIPTWIGGGGGIDALVGRQTRDHADLDVAVVDGRGALAALAAAGFEVVTDWWPGRMAMQRPDGSEVDVHPIVFRDDGSAVHTSREGQEFLYPVDGFTVGVIAGREVPCITAALQEVFHSGYEPQTKDLTDLATLRSAGLIAEGTQ